MNKLRNEYLYTLTGIIKGRWRKTASEGTNYAGQLYYQLPVIIEREPTIKLIQVFQDKLTNPEIWGIIERKECTGKKYRLSCRNHRGSYHLVDWKELETKNHGK